MRALALRDTGREAPGEEHSREIWRLLIDPVWPVVQDGGGPSYLVLSDRPMTCSRCLFKSRR